MKEGLVCGDVMETLRALPDGSIDMVYGDPDYGVGIQYAGSRYTQKWDEYLAWYLELAAESMRVLKDDGNLFLINYPKQNAHLRALQLDEIAHDVFEYVWIYPTNVGHSPRRFTNAHRSILHAVKGPDNRFYKAAVAEPYRNPGDPRIQERIEQGSPGRMPYSWLQFDLVKNVSKGKTLHACQIPLGLFTLLLRAATKKGDLAFILFGGSGSEILRAQQLGRRWLACELEPSYQRMIQERLKSGGAIAEEFRLHGDGDKGLQLEIFREES